MSAILSNQGNGFRRMRDCDLDEIMDIERNAYEFCWTLGIMRDCLRVGYLCWLYESDGRIEAYGVLSVAAGEAHVLNLCVRKESQGQGLGRKMLRQLIELARRQGAETVLLEVRGSNLAAVRLYHSEGFNEVGVRKDYYPDHHGREDALILARELGA